MNRRCDAVTADESSIEPDSLAWRLLLGVWMLIGIVFISTGCTTSRVTTTDRTAVEQALLARTAEDVIGQFMAVPPAEGRGFRLDETGLDGPDKIHIAAAMKARFLKDGLRLTTGTAPSDATIVPRVLMSGIDDDEYLLGIPSIPIPVPGYATVHLPEMAIFKLHTQRGRTELGYTAYESASGAPLANQDPLQSTRKYRRWTIFFVLMFRTGDLGDPF